MRKHGWFRPHVRGLTAISSTTLREGGGDIQSLFADAEGDYWEAFNLSGTLDAAVQSLPGKRGHHDFTQATSGNRPILKARADGVRYLDFASAKSMSVASSTALFKYLHDGTGGTVLALIEYPQSEVASSFLLTASGDTQAGIVIQKSSTSQNGFYLVWRAASGTTAAGMTTQQLARSGRQIMLAVGYKNDGGASDAFWSFDSGATRFNGAGSGNAPSSADAGQNLTITSSFGGKLYALLAIDRVLTQAEVAQVYQIWMNSSRYTVPDVDLTIAVGGQSNASGRGLLSPTSLPTVDGVWIYDKSEEYRQAYEPSHAILNQPVVTSPTEPAIGSPQFSFPLAVGSALKTDAAKTSLWVPCSVGSTAMAQWDTPATSEDRSTLFGAFKYRFNKAKAEKGGTPVIVWYGHESDTGLPVADYVNGGVGSAYQNAWTSLVTNLRAAVGDVPLVFVQLASDNDLSTAVQHALVGEAQRQTELSLENTYMVVAHDLARNASTDDIHLSQAGQKVLAARISLAIRQHILLEAVNGTGPRIVGATKSGSTVTLTCNKAVNTTAGNYGNLFRVYDNGVEATVSSASRNGGDTSKIDIVCSAPLSGPVTLTYGFRAGPASAARTDFVADADGLPLPLFGPLLAA